MRRFKIIEHQTYNRNSYHSNPLFMSVFNDSPDAIFILDPYDFQILDCNKKALELFQAVDKVDFNNLQSFNLYGSEPVEFSKRHFIQETQKGKEYVQELNFRTFKNNIFWGRLYQKLIGIEDNKLVILRISKIIDYNKTSEVLDTLIKHTSRETGRSFFRVLTRLLASAFEAKYVMIAKLKNDAVNSAKSIEFYAGNAPDENFEFGLANGPFSNLMNGYITYYPNNLRELFPGYKLIEDLGIESFIGAPVFDRDGIVNAMLVIMDDKPMQEKLNSRNILSIFAARTGAEMERLMEEDELRRNSEKLNNANLTKDRFLQVIAHDLKNPFHTILGYCELLRKKIDIYDKSKIKEFVNIIDLSVRSNYALLDNLTEWSRVQRGVIQFSPEKVDLYNVILDANELFYLAAERKGIRLVNRIKPDTEITADINMLRAIIRNLVSNAIKFSGQNTDIILSAIEKGKEFIISVTDSGLGMSEEMIREKLDKDCCTSMPGTDNEKGTGIGLSICKDFISRHNGRLMIRSKEGEGTTISFTIPQ
ncbi:MAG: PAS domain-containing protein [Bacteroidales bacterium]|nr:PAS domain-containing protein [Bacteroidales bacterium]